MSSATKKSDADITNIGNNPQKKTKEIYGVTMNIIDAHIHFSKIAAFRKAAGQNGVDYSLNGLVTEGRRNRIVAGICMGLSETREGSFPDKQAETPMAYNLDALPVGFCYCAGINPHRLSPDALKKLELALQGKDCAGIKIYAGYYHYMVTSVKYEPVYRLALKYKLPVVIHSGDTYNENGLLKYSQPLTIDQLAVRYPEMKIVIAHLGNPWLMDTAELLYKNPNVYADLSGLLVGDKSTIGRFTAQELYLNMFRTALILADSYDKLLFGTDWPLIPIDAYIGFIQQIIPEKHHQAVFYYNALRVFERIENSELRIENSELRIENSI